MTAEGTKMPGGARRLVVVSVAIAVLALGAVLAVVLIASDGPREPSSQFPPQVFAPAPRECPASITRGNRVERGGIPTLMNSHLPSSLPAGFGVQFAWEERDTNGVLWVDERCREIMLLFIQGTPSSPPPGPRVGAWVMTANVPDGCSNEVLGTSRCLTYLAAAPDGDLGLQLMGFEVDEGNAIARSIHVSSQPGS